MGHRDKTEVSRLSMNLTKRATDELEALHQETGMSKTDLVCRAIGLYFFMDDQFRSGNNLFVRQKDGDEVMQIHIQ